MSDRDPYAFHTFPRGDLQVPIGRRQALLTLVTESKVRDGQSRGGNAFKLSALGSLADELLGLMTPAPMPGCRVTEEKGLVWAHLSGQEQPVELFPAGSPARSVFDRFDGRTRLEVVAHDLAAEQDWEAEKGFAYVRGLFLHLITLGVCVPH